MTRLIGLAGRVGAGKSFAAAVLAAELGAERVRFAGPLKEMLRVLGLGDDELEGHLKETPCDKLCGKTPRFAMISVGTEWGRDLIGPSLWTDAWARRADKVLADGGSVIVEDVRFLNEVDEIQSRGGMVIWIEREGLSRADLNHVSESLEAEDCDLSVLNTGDERFSVALKALFRVYGLPTRPDYESGEIRAEQSA